VIGPGKALVVLAHKIAAAVATARELRIMECKSKCYDWKGYWMADAEWAFRLKTR
jgi:hypothetical protein